MFLSDREWRIIADQLRLSPRQLEIARLVVEGLSDEGIAERLPISSHTVHAHIGRLYRNLDVRDRSQLVVRLFAQYVALKNNQDPTVNVPRERC